MKGCDHGNTASRTSKEELNLSKTPKQICKAFCITEFHGLISASFSVGLGNPFATDPMAMIRCFKCVVNVS